MKFLPPFLKGSLRYILSWIHALLVLGKDIPLKYVFKHNFLSIVLFKSDNHISFPLFGLTFLVIYMI